MLINKHNKTLDDICNTSPVIPVLVFHDMKHVMPIAEALVQGGIKVLEVTLRTDIALDAIKALKKAKLDAFIGAGTVLNPAQYQQAAEAGSDFIVTPGISQQLLDAGNHSKIPLLPGIQTLSELMLGINQGYERFKFFPAEISGGIDALKAFHGPVPSAQFCPTGGITTSTAHLYLQESNVMCVGGSWLTPKELIDQQKWEDIYLLAKKSSQLKK